MEKTTMGERISKLRREKSMTQEELAEKLGVSAQAVSKWENNVCCPDISIIPKMASIFGVSTDMLLGVEEAPKAAEAKAEAVPKKALKAWKRSFKLHALAPALFVILLGASLLWNSMAGLGIGFWKIFLIDGIIAIGACAVFSRITPFSLGALALGVIYHLVAFDVIKWTDKYDGMIIPALIILVGLSMFYNVLFPKKCHKRIINGINTDKSTRFDAKEQDGVLEYSLSFGDDSYCVNSTDFKGGSISVSFSDATVDFSNVTELADGAELDVSVSFGELTILLPRNIAIIDGDKNGVFSDFASSGGSPDADAKPLILTASVSFGVLNIKYK